MLLPISNTAAVFAGLAILSTNLRANIDEAFARRISIVVDFARPDEHQRRRLYQQFLSTVPLAADIDIDFCAQAFDLTGGNIRNIAVTAAYLAAANGAVLHMRDLIEATTYEYRKLGRLCVEAEFGRFFLAEKERWARVIRETGAKID